MLTRWLNFCRDNNREHSYRDFYMTLDRSTFESFERRPHLRNQARTTDGWLCKCSHRPVCAFMFGPRLTIIALTIEQQYWIVERDHRSPIAALVNHFHADGTLLVG